MASPEYKNVDELKQCIGSNPLNAERQLENELLNRVLRVSPTTLDCVLWFYLLLILTLPNGNLQAFWLGHSTQCHHYAQKALKMPSFGEQCRCVLKSNHTLH